MKLVTIAVVMIFALSAASASVYAQGRGNGQAKKTTVQSAKPAAKAQTRAVKAEARAAKATAKTETRAAKTTAKAETRATRTGHDHNRRDRDENGGEKPESGSAAASRCCRLEPIFKTRRWDSRTGASSSPR